MALKYFSNSKTLKRLKAERSLHIHKCNVKKGSGSLSAMIYVCHIKKRPFLYGVGSLGNVSGGYSRLRIYLRGNYVQDMRNDWLKVGDAFRQSLHSYKK